MIRNTLKALALISTLALAGSGSERSVNANRVEGIFASKNLLPNSGWERTSNSWTASGGTYARTTTAAQIGTGDGGGSWDSGSASQTLTSTAVAIPQGMYAKNGVASCSIKAASAATHTLQAYDGTNIIASATITSSTDTFARTSVNFVFPSSGNISLRLVSVASDEPAIYVDDCFLGLAESFNVGSVSQATLYGTATWAQVSNCAWTTASTSGGTYASYGVDSDCNNPTVTGSVEAPTTKIPGIRLRNLPPGNYMIIARGKFLTGAGLDAVIRFTDGTNNFPGGALSADSSFNLGHPTIIGQISYTTAQSDITIQPQWASTGSAGTGVIQNDSAGESYNIDLYRFPTTSEVAYRPEQNNKLGYATWDGGTGKSATVSGAAWTTFSDADFATRTNSGAAENPTSTSTLGFKVSNIPQGLYMVVAQGLLYPDASNACSFAIYDGTTRLGFSQAVSPSASGVDSQNTLTAIFKYDSVQSSKEFVVQGYNYSGAGNCNAYFADASYRGFQMSFIPLNQGITAPVLVGSVTSNSTSAERLERARINCDSGSAITSQSGGWLSSVGNVSSGACTLTMAAGMFSAAPTCTTVIEQSATSTHAVKLSSTSTSTIVSLGIDTGSGATLGSYDFDIICMGPR